MKKGAIRGLGSTVPYTGRAYISVTMFMHRVSGPFWSFTGTFGYSSGAGSVSSQAQSKAARACSSLETLGSSTQPSRQRMLPPARIRSLVSSVARTCWT